MKEMVMSEETIFGICKRLGEEISKDLQNEEKLPIFVCVMKGAIQFMVDLMKHVTIPSIIDYVQLSSYEGTSSTGNVKLIKDMSYSVDGSDSSNVTYSTGRSKAYVMIPKEETVDEAKIKLDKILGTKKYTTSNTTTTTKKAN